jgi:hypothetical protein
MMGSEERKEGEKETRDRLPATRLRRLRKKARTVELHQGSCLLVARGRR